MTDLRALAGLLTALGALSMASPAQAAVAVTPRVNSPYPVGAGVEFAANAVGTGALSYTWDFGDGQISEPSASGTVVHTYVEPGHYPIIVRVEDETGASRSASFLQTVHRPLPTNAPQSSSTIIHQSAQQRVCNTNVDNDTVSCLSTDTMEVLFEVPVGRHPRSLAAGADGSLWVTNQDDATVSVLDVSGAPLHTIALPRASRPFGIVMNSARGVAYVALQASGELAELDLATFSVKRRVPVGPWATGLAVDASGARLFVTRFLSSPQAGEFSELAAESLEVVRRFELALDPGPDTEATARGVPNYLRSVVPSPDGTALWVPAKKDNILRGLARDGEALTFETSVRSMISIIDLSSNDERFLERTDMNNRSLGLSLAFSPLGDYAFVGLLGNNGVEIIDTYNRKIVAGTMELGKAPDGLVLDDKGRLYVNSFLSRSVVILDASEILASTNFGLPELAEVVVSTAEKLDPQVLAGKIVFYDASDLRMGKDGYISCAVCHLDGLDDGQVWDFTDRGEGLRNTTTLLGKRGIAEGRLHWSGNFDEVQDFEHDIRGAFGGVGFLSDEVFNEGTRNTTLGDSKAGLSPELDAMSAYVTSLDRVHDSPFRDPDGSLTVEGLRGRDIFLQAGCPACHGGSDFTNSASGTVYDVGTITAASGKRLGQTLEGIDTPTLRGIWETAPYLHDGSAASLGEVVGSKNPADLHGQTQGLTDLERLDLVSYLLQIDNTALEDEVEPTEPEPTEPEPTEPVPTEPEPTEPVPTEPEPTEPTPGSGGGGCAVIPSVPSGGGRLWFFGALVFASCLRRRRIAKPVALRASCVSSEP